MSFLLIVVAILLVATTYFLTIRFSKNKFLAQEVAPVKLDNRSLDCVFEELIKIKSSVEISNQTLSKKLIETPEAILKSITGSSSTHKGKLGELIGYLILKSEYDRIIPLGNIVDFIGIKFPTETTPGQLDLIDIKTGDNARLNKDQKLLQSIIQNKNINFRTIKVEDVKNVSAE